MIKKHYKYYLIPAILLTLEIILTIFLNDPNGYLYTIIGISFLYFIYFLILNIAVYDCGNHIKIGVNINVISIIVINIIYFADITSMYFLTGIFVLIYIGLSYLFISIHKELYNTTVKISIALMYFIIRIIGVIFLVFMEGMRSIH